MLLQIEAKATVFPYGSIGFVFVCSWEQYFVEWKTASGKLAIKILACVLTRYLCNNCSYRDLCISAVCHCGTLIQFRFISGHQQGPLLE